MAANHMGSAYGTGPSLDTKISLSQVWNKHQVKEREWEMNTNTYKELQHNWGKQAKQMLFYLFGFVFILTANAKENEL